MKNKQNMFENGALVFEFVHLFYYLCYIDKTENFC